MKKIIILFLFFLTVSATACAGESMELLAQDFLTGNSPTAMVVGNDGTMYVAIASQEYRMTSDQTKVHSKILILPSDEAFLTASDFTLACDVDGVIYDMKFSGDQLVALQFRDHERKDKRQYNLVSLDVSQNKVSIISTIPQPVEKLEVIDENVLYALSGSKSYLSNDGGRIWNQIVFPLSYASYTRHTNDIYFLRDDQLTRKFYLLPYHNVQNKSFTPIVQWETKKEVWSPIFLEDRLFFYYQEDDEPFLLDFESDITVKLLDRKLKVKDALVKIICSDKKNGLFLSFFENETPLSLDSRLVRYYEGKSYVSEAFIHPPRYLGQTDNYVYFVSRYGSGWRVLAYPINE